jgi:hypothetical protein
MLFGSSFLSSGNMFKHVPIVILYEHDTSYIWVCVQNGRGYHILFGSSFLSSGNMFKHVPIVILYEHDTSYIWVCVQNGRGYHILFGSSFLSSGILFELSSFRHNKIHHTFKILDN